MKKYLPIFVSIVIATVLCGCSHFEDDPTLGASGSISSTESQTSAQTVWYQDKDRLAFTSLDHGTDELPPVYPPMYASGLYTIVFPDSWTGRYNIARYNSSRSSICLQAIQLYEMQPEGIIAYIHAIPINDYDAFVNNCENELILITKNDEWAYSFELLGQEQYAVESAQYELIKSEYCSMQQDIRDGSFYFICQ